MDADGEIVAVNGRAEALFRLRRDELVGRPLDNLFSWPWLRLRRADGSGLELPAVRGDGSEFPAEISLAEFDGPGGTLTAAAIRDGSERAGREAELREARERLRRVFEFSPVASASSRSRRSWWRWRSWARISGSARRTTRSAG